MRSETLPPDQDLLPLVAWSTPIRAAYALADRHARRPWPVLIVGPTGAGKGELARFIHRRSRPNRPFVDATAGELIDTLLGSQLFGHTEGAFTDAKRATPGFFERAAGGTLFLDEIQHWSPALQSALLKPTGEGQFLPVGASRALDVTCRLIYAGTEHPDDPLARGKLLPDLRHRLPLLPIVVPRLAERRADILPLAQSFHQRLAVEVGLPPRPHWSSAAIRALLLDPWPGNVRELRERIRASLLRWDGATAIGPDDLGIGEVRIGDYLDHLATDDIAAVVRWALQFTAGAKGEAASLLGVHRNTFRDWLSRGEFQSDEDANAQSRRLEGNMSSRQGRAASA